MFSENLLESCPNEVLSNAHYLSFDIFAVGNLLNISMKYDLYLIPFLA